MFGWEEVYMGFSMDDFAKVRDAVTHGGIAYKRKIFARAGAFLGRGRVSHSSAIIGNHTDYTKQYRLFVRSKDAEQARYLIRQALNTVANTD